MTGEKDKRKAQNTDITSDRLELFTEIMAIDLALAELNFIWVHSR